MTHLECLDLTKLLFDRAQTNQLASFFLGKLLLTEMQLLFESIESLLVEVVGVVDLLVKHLEILVSLREVAGDLLLILLLQVVDFRLEVLLLLCELGLETLFVRLVHLSQFLQLSVRLKLQFL